MARAPRPHEAALELHAIVDPFKLFQPIAWRARRIANAHSVVVFGEQNGLLFARAKAGRALSNAALHSMRRPIPLPRLLPLQQLQRELQAIAQERKLNLHVLPLRAPQKMGGRLVGAIAFLTPPPRRFEPQKNTALMHYLEHAGLAVHKTRITATDALTGMYQLGYFEQHLKHEMELAKRHKKPVGLQFIDMRNLSRVNELGHAAGNVYKRTVAELLKAKARRTDGIYLWGGDEFTIIMPGVNEERAEKLRRRMLRAINSRMPEARKRILDSIAPESGEERKRARAHLAGIDLGIDVGHATSERLTMHELLAAADKRMMIHKAQRKAALAKNT
jgi:diguanylate cyclase (GGDEF)-like protein